MAKVSETRPRWAREFLATLKPPTKTELMRRREALKLAWENRADIRPDTTTELVRAIREGEGD
jgi:DNA-binding transcriptional ArsR family regulator